MKNLLIPITDSFQGKEYLTKLLQSVTVGQIHTKFRIVPLWDSCRDSFIEEFYEAYPFLLFDEELINKENPLRFTGNVNRGLRFCKSKFNSGCLVVQQDCELPPVELVDLIENTGIMLPTECIISQEQEEVKQLEVGNITGFCFYISPETIDKIGYLDEWLKYGYETLDYACRASLAGMEISRISINVTHHLGKFNTYDTPHFLFSKQLFALKYRIPKDVADTELMKWIIENHKYISEMYIK